MISLTYVRTMERYNRWMNDRLYECCTKLSDEERKRDVSAFFRSIHGTLNHLLLADRIWLGRFTGEPFAVKSLDQELYSDFAQLHSERKATDRAISEWVSSLSGAGLAGELFYMSVVNPRPRRYPLWVAVAHFFNHQTHHRGQLTTLLFQRGVDPGVTDLIWLPEQLEAYREVARAMEGRPVVIRTLDIGADKAFEGDEHAVMPNPALGLRAIRFCLAEPQIFVTQLRAILRASQHGRVRILLPMLAHVHEIEQSLALLAQAKQQLEEKDIAYDRSIEVGGMIEIPAAALALPMFMRRLNFLSLGTNDLIQYTLAIDRTDDAVAHLYDPLHPAVLHLIAHTIHTANRSGTPIAVCGEMAGEPSLTRLLLGFGLRNFSMHPAQVLAIKERVLRTDLAQAQPLAQRVLRQSDPRKTRELLAKLNA